MRHWLLTLTAVSATLWAAQTCHAQGIGRPTISPYLNLAQPFGIPAVNYYSLVRPQIAFRNAIQNLEQGVAADQNAIANSQAANAFPATGHSVGFQTHQRYFGTYEVTRPAGAGSGAGSGGSGTPASA